jgi:hypothetical protein
MVKKRDAGMGQRLERVETQIEHVRDDIRRFTESVGSVIERLDRQYSESQVLEPFDIHVAI